MNRWPRTRTAPAALCLAALLGACAGGPPTPEWRLGAQGALRSFESAYLRGETRVAEQAFARARHELASTGDAELVARAELTRCALRVASLEFDDCPGFAPLAPDAGARARAYAAYIGGRWQGIDATLLPTPHRAVLARGGDGGALVTIDDPVSKLVAAGALFRVGRSAPADIATAVDTAAANGWRRPLVAWLGVQEQRAQAAGDAQAAAAIRRRIELVLDAPR
ncbi:MAG TPA: hypothetical protein VK052_00650 [Zeimonas sp.]|nr:hypothetical protein [Zeimonas sp.]